MDVILFVVLGQLQPHPHAHERGGGQEGGTGGLPEYDQRDRRAHEGAREK
jgi:hypothetical protein